MPWTRLLGHLKNISFQCFHNLMRVHYPSPQNSIISLEGSDPAVTPGARSDSVVLTEIDWVCGNVNTQEGKRQHVYLTQYYSSPRGVWLSRTGWCDCLIFSGTLILLHVLNVHPLILDWIIWFNCVGHWLLVMFVHLLIIYFFPKPTFDYYYHELSAFFHDFKYLNLSLLVISSRVPVTIIYYVCNKQQDKWNSKVSERIQSWFHCLRRSSGSNESMRLSQYKWVNHWEWDRMRHWSWFNSSEHK